MRETENTTNCDVIRPIRFSQEISKVTQIVSEGFQSVVEAEGIDTTQYMTLAKQPHIAFLLGSLHPFLSQFFEIFVWTHEQELVGTGTVQRVDLDDKTRWLLCNFAVTRSLRVTRQAVIKMITLMRRAIEHARLNGAVEVLAHVREDNRTVLAICRDEGFEVVGGYSDYLIHPARVEILQQAINSYQEITLRRPRVSAANRVVWSLVRSIVGLDRSTFVAQLEGNPIGEIEILIHPGPLSAHQLDIRPSCDLTPMLAFNLIACGIAIACQNRQSVLISLPIGCRPLIEVMEKQEIPVVFKRKHLLLRTDRETSSRIGR
jgi:ribosomal protein S18 acetylase RimI-like enzyme